MAANIIRPTVRVLQVPELSVPDAPHAAGVSESMSANDVLCCDWPIFALTGSSAMAPLANARMKLIISPITYNTV